MKRNSASRTSAFTLLEIMLVVAIITLLLSAGFMMLKGQFGFAQETRVNSDFATFKTCLKTYEMQNGIMPTTEQGLQALVVQPQTDPKPTSWHSMMEELPKDPWGRDYVYLCPGKHNPQGFDIVSKGPDGIIDTADDMGNWKKETAASH